MIDLVLEAAQQGAPDGQLCCKCTRRWFGVPSQSCSMGSKPLWADITRLAPRPEGRRHYAAWSACPVCNACRVMRGWALLLDSTLGPGLAERPCQRGTLPQRTMRDPPSIVMFTCLQVAAQAGDTDSYWCHDLRAMPAASIDPSLAVGFLCRSRGQRCSCFCCPCSNSKLEAA